MTNDNARPIGTAFLDENGVLHLQLRAEGPGGIIGDAVFELRPDDSEYGKWMAHLGGIEIGKPMAVRPWPT